jgi:hypothetical protein
MVRRLIEQNDIRAGQEKFSERNAGFLPPGEGRYFFAEVFFREPKTFQDADYL